MKKIHLLFSLPLMLSLVGCGGTNNSTSSLPQTSSTSTVDDYGDPNVVDIVVLAGQSNMEGHSWVGPLINNTPSKMHDYYLDGFENTEIMYYCNNGGNKSEFFTPVKAGQGYDKTRFGPEVGIAEELMMRGRKRPVYIVKYALGATSLYNHSHWNADSNNGLFTKMVNYVHEQIYYFENQDIDVRIKGLFWMQGEADSCDAGGLQGTRYYDDLSNFVTKFREEFEEEHGDPEKGIAFVDAGISNCSTWTHYETVNAAKADFAESDPTKNYYFDTMEEGLEYRYDNSDFFHFDATSELKLGKLFISKLLDNGWL